MKPNQLAQHHVYKVFYGVARIKCLVLWIFPEGDRNIGCSRRNVVKRKRMNKPKLSNMSKEEYVDKMKVFKAFVAKEREAYRALQSGIHFKRPPKQEPTRVSAIILPLVPYDIEIYKKSAFEKDHRGKLMFVEKKSIIGIGLVDRVVSFSADRFKSPVNRGI
ncbi:hypothetical protein HW132_35645 [Brasilonema sp. CT11]|nr:hypothetical protein [Brasilonema sp. CT11]